VLAHLTQFGSTGLMRASVGFGVDGRGGPDGLTWVQIDGPSLVRFSIGGLQFSHGYVAVLDVMMLPPRLMLCLLIHEKRVNRIVGYYPARIDDCEIKPADICVLRALTRYHVLPDTRARLIILVSTYWCSLFSNFISPLFGIFFSTT
jgi:hypothetical protein